MGSLEAKALCRREGNSNVKGECIVAAFIKGIAHLEVLFKRTNFWLLHLTKLTGFVQMQ